MTQLSVICPSAPWENETTDPDRAWDLCLSLSEEYGYAQVRQNGQIIGEYRDGRWTGTLGAQDAPFTPYDYQDQPKEPQWPSTLRTVMLIVRSILTKLGLLPVKL